MGGEEFVREFERFERYRAYDGIDYPIELRWVDFCIHGPWFLATCRWPPDSCHQLPIHTSCALGWSRLTRQTKDRAAGKLRTPATSSELASGEVGLVGLPVHMTRPTGLQSTRDGERTTCTHAGIADDAVQVVLSVRCLRNVRGPGRRLRRHSAYRPPGTVGVKQESQGVTAMGMRRAFGTRTGADGLPCVAPRGRSIQAFPEHRTGRELPRTRSSNKYENCGWGCSVAGFQHKFVALQAE